MFPVIKHLNDLLPFIDGNEQFRVQEQPNGTKVVCYMIQDEDTFKGEHQSMYRECRGITFGADGSVVSRTLHKFKNVGEDEGTQAFNIPWDRIVRVMDKRDGSMITTVLLPDGTIQCKTKKTFTSAEAVAATEFLHADPRRVQWVRKRLEAGLTPTFEWTSPRFPIVLLYEKDELTLLQIRENVSGRYLQEWEHRLGAGPMAAFAEDCPFPMVENLIDNFTSAGKVMWSYFEQAALNTEGVEGWIAQADNGQMWKIKTKWYVNLHHQVVFMRERDIAEAVLDDTTDDLKGAFAISGRSIEPILRIERLVHSRINEIKSEVERISGAGIADDRSAKDMATEFKVHQYFGLVMRAFKGAEPDYTEFYRKNFLKLEFSLNVIINETQ